MKKYASGILVLIFCLTINAIGQPNGNPAPAGEGRCVYEVKFNAATCLYEAHMIVTDDYEDPLDDNLGTSAFSIVIPASYANSPITATSVNPSAALWVDNTPVYAPAAAPGSDFHKFATGGAAFNPGTLLTAGSDILLFTFSLPSTGCVAGIRLFVNWDWSPYPQSNPDPTSAASGMGGGDFRNSVQTLWTGESYTGNQNNTGTIFPAYTPTLAHSCSGTDITLVASTPGLSACMMSGMTYEWKKDDVTLATTSTSSYTIPNYTAGKYEVVTKNAFGCTSFKTLNINSSCFILPVTLLNFDARKQGSQTLVTWQTSQEQNSHHFDVEHSTNGVSFVKIGEVAAAGNTNDLRNYSFIHPNPAKGNNFYRLKMVDIDTRFKQSDIRLVKFDQRILVQVYPNPTAGQVFISSDNGTVLKSVMLYTVDGRLLLQYDNMISGKSINLANFTNGTYVVKIIDSEGNLTVEKVLKQ
ncbi:MAG TPA: T9SS type A sorting domain-containing protein [Chitinophagaceae bacterium]|nr:T9SS type A sorting domain-containing protein [Chitinophagaceae bacterium]